LDENEYDIIGFCMILFGMNAAYCCCSIGNYIICSYLTFMNGVSMGSSKTISSS